MQGVCIQDRGMDNRVVQQGAQAQAVQDVRAFRTVDQATRWAFATVERSAAKVANYIPTVAGTGERMTPLEMRAQASMIIASIMALPDDQADYMVAAYAWRDVAGALGRLQLMAKRNMPPALPELTVALVDRHIRSVRGLEVEGLRLTAARHQVGYKAARNRDEKVRAWLAPVWLGAESALMGKWALTGLIHP